MAVQFRLYNWLQILHFTIWGLFCEGSLIISGVDSGYVQDNTKWCCTGIVFIVYMVWRFMFIGIYTIQLFQPLWLVLSSSIPVLSIATVSNSSRFSCCLVTLLQISCFLVNGSLVCWHPGLWWLGPFCDVTALNKFSYLHILIQGS